MQKEPVFLSNLKIWREAAEENRELRLLQIDQAASEPLLAAQLQSNEEEGLPIHRILRVDEQIALCKALSKEPSTVQESEPRPMPHTPRIAILAGDIFFRALSCFSPLLPEAITVTVSTVTELAESVFDGNADLAILPIGDGRGNRLLSFYELLDRRDLVISCTCSIIADDSQESLRFALISKGYDLPELPDSQTLLECRLTDRTPGALTELLFAAQSAGLMLYRIDCTPNPYIEDTFIYYCIFDAPKKDVALFTGWLEQFMPNATLLGTYQHIQEG